MKRWLTLLILLSGPLVAQEIEMPRLQTWKASVAALGVATAADIATSYGRSGMERNPIFGETFGGRDAALKTGVIAGVTITQYLLIRRYPGSKAAKVFARMNFVAAAATGAVAANNARINRCYGR